MIYDDDTYAFEIKNALYIRSMYVHVCMYMYIHAKEVGVSYQQ